MQQTNKARILRELENFQKEQDKDQKNKDQVHVQKVGDDVNHWKGYIKGPEGTVYEGGVFQVDIKLPADYPYKPPKMQFDTKLWHPNVSSQTGAICLDILKNEWSPALSIRTALLSLIVLMQCPEPDDPQDAQVATEYKNNREAFNKNAREWTKLYANDSYKNEKVQKLVEMGFTQQQATEALRKFGFEEEKALNYLLGGN